MVNKSVGRMSSGGNPEACPPKTPTPENLQKADRKEEKEQ